MHVWVDGGQLQVVDHVNTIGAVTGQTVPVSSPSPATGPQGDEESGDSVAGLSGALGKTAMGGFAIHQSIQGAASFAGHPDVGQVAGDAASTAATIGAAALVNPFLALGAAVAILPQKLMDWSSALIEGRRDIAMFSGELQYTFGEAERRTAIRGIQSADSLGASTSALSSEYQDLLDMIRPIKDTVTKDLQNIMTGILAILQASPVLKIAEKYPEYIDAILSGMTGIAGFLGKILESQEKKDSDTNFEEWAKFVRSGMGHLPTLRPLGP